MSATPTVPMNLRSPHQIRIDRFMSKAGQELPPAPCVPSEAVRILRAKLILEEALETVHALGVSVRVTLQATGRVLVNGATNELSLLNVEDHQLGFTADREPDLVEIADGCADLSVVTIGTLSACGISDELLLGIVDESNLRKFGPGGHRRDDGKWVKPADWVAPDIAGLLADLTAYAAGGPGADTRTEEDFAVPSLGRGVPSSGEKPQTARYGDSGGTIDDLVS